MDFRLNEDFFDDIDQDEIINTDDIDDEPDEEKHKIVICVDTLRDKEYNKTYINNNRIREIDKYIRAFCYHTVIFKSYKISYLKPGLGLTDYVDIDNLPTFRYNRFRVRVEYTINKKTTMNQFISTIQKFAALVYRILTDKYYYRLTQKSLVLNIDNEEKMFLITHLYKSHLESVYRRVMGLTVLDYYNDMSKRINYSITPAPKLSPISKKKLKDMEVGDVLYSTNRGELVLDEETNGKRNIPIAIYVSMNRWSHCPCFVSIKYISNINPKTGSIMPVEMFFGSYGIRTEENQDLEKQEDPLDLNAQIYNYMNKPELDIFSTDNFVRNSYTINSIPPVQSCYHFSPIGTKKGQWYIPNVEQLHDLYENKEIINQTRKNLGYDELADCYFYSCNETSAVHISIVDLGNNREDRHQLKYQEEDLCAIAFININSLL